MGVNFPKVVVMVRPPLAINIKLLIAYNGSTLLATRRIILKSSKIRVLFFQCKLLLIINRIIMPIEINAKG